MMHSFSLNFRDNSQIMESFKTKIRHCLHRLHHNFTFDFTLVSSSRVYPFFFQSFSFFLKATFPVCKSSLVGKFLSLFFARFDSTGPDKVLTTDLAHKNWQEKQGPFLCHLQYHTK